MLLSERQNGLKSRAFGDCRLPSCRQSEATTSAEVTTAVEKMTTPADKTATAVVCATTPPDNSNRQNQSVCQQQEVGTRCDEKTFLTFRFSYRENPRKKVTCKSKFHFALVNSMGWNFFIPKIIQKYLFSVIIESEPEKCACE